LVIDRVSALCADDFYRTYWTPSRPVVLQGFVAQWPAFARWSPRYLANLFGDIEVETMCRLRSDRCAEGLQYQTRQRMALARVVELMRAPERPGEPYIVAQNQVLRRPELALLWDDLPCDPSWFDAERARVGVSMWFGPADTVTPLHFDLQDVLLAQVFGSKRVTLAAPNQAPFLYNSVGGYAHVDPDAPDHKRYPLFRRAVLAQVTILPGDALYIPHSWWHQVRSMTTSISLSLGHLRGKRR
jgi:ribosomal protein L16 Arg81 hydroxylase